MATHLKITGVHSRVRRARDEEEELVCFVYSLERNTSVRWMCIPPWDLCFGAKLQDDVSGRWGEGNVPAVESPTPPTELLSTHLGLRPGSQAPFPALKFHFLLHIFSKHTTAYLVISLA